MGELENLPNKATKIPLTKRCLDGIAFFLKDQWFLVGIAIVTLIASQVQVPLAQQETKQVVVSYTSVTLIFFITGCTLDTNILIANYAKWKHHLFIQTQCFFLVSALAFAIVSLAALNHNFLDPWLIIGFIFNGTQPTAMASNVLFTRQSHGNAALTVVETTIGNLLGPFLTPALIKMYLSSDEWYTKAIPPQSTGFAGLYRRVFMQFGLSIYLPMAIGQLVRRFTKREILDTLFIRYKLSRLGSLGMLTLLWQTMDHAFATGAFGTLKTSNTIFLVFITIANYFLWLAIALFLSGTQHRWLDRKDTVAVVMCVPAKTLALGMPLSFLLFTGITAVQEAKIQLPMLIFQILQMGIASLLTLVFRRWVDAGEKRDEEKVESNNDEVERERVVDSSKDIDEPEKLAQ